MTTSTVRPARTTTAPRSTAGFLPFAVFACDVVAIGLAVVAALLGRGSVGLPDAAASTLSESLELAGPIIVVGWLAILVLMGSYRQAIFGAGIDEYKRVVSSSFATAAAVGIGCYLARIPLSRGYFLLLFLIGIPLIVVGRYLVRRLIHQARRNGALQQRVVIAGSESHVDEVATVLHRETWLGYHVVGAVIPDPGRRTKTEAGTPIIERSARLADVARSPEVDIVCLAGGAFDSSRGLRDLVWGLEYEDVQIVVAPSVTDMSSERLRMRPVGGLPLIHLEKPRSSHAARLGKRAFDIAGSIILLALMAPILMVAAAAIALHDRGPILFRQVRVGRGGEVFGCWKLRTMVIDAEAMLAALHAQRGYEEGLFKLREDPRVTPPGHWLRRFSIDEVPQLVNVLRGDMSLVGPRPPLPHEVAKYEPHMHRRLRVRPGMTGLWQISGRSDLSWSEAIRLDLHYVDNWSMLQDLTILARTLSTVLRRQGAY